MKDFYLIILLFLAGISLAACQSNIEEANYEVIPIPLEISLQQGNPYILSANTKICYNSKKLQTNAQFLSSYIKDMTGLKITTLQAGEDTGIFLEMTESDSLSEAYQIEVNERQVTISGSEKGIFYGIQTLRKSLPIIKNGNVALPAAIIKDSPRFAYRGAMLDVGRHFFTLDSIKRYIDILALHNINYLHWHLTEDQGWRIEIKKHPELTQKGSVRSETVIGHNSGKYDGKPYGGFYTQEEAKELVKYAADRQITIIPEIDMPGHMMSALHVYPQLGCTGGPYKVRTEWGVSDDVLCAGNDETLDFLKDVFSELIEIFPSEYIHVGGDECPKVRWKSCRKCQERIKSLGIKGDKKHSAEEYLQSYVIGYVEKFLNSKGRRIIGWDEILEGGIAPNATVMSWRGEAGGIEAAKQQHDVIMTPNTYLYFDYYQSDDIQNEPEAIGGYLPVNTVYSYEPMPGILNEDEQKHIIGVQANVWTEYMSNFKKVEYMVLPRFAALSEVQWTQAGKKDYAYFLKRLNRLVNIYDLYHLNYATHVFDIQDNIKTDCENSSLIVSLKTIDNCPIYYTLDGSIPTINSNVYTQPLIIKTDCKLRAVGIRNNGTTRMFSKDFNTHKACFKPISMLQPIHQSYSFNGAQTLLDGMNGDYNYKTGDWIGFHNNDLEAVIDMKEATEFSSISINTLVNKGDWIFDIRKLSVSVSDNGKDFKAISAQEYSPMSQYDENKIYTHTLKFPAIKARFIKIMAATEHQLPEWHPGNGHPAFIFVDEISVR